MLSDADFKAYSRPERKLIETNYLSRIEDEVEEDLQHNNIQISVSCH